jgi:hypothetical protein
VSGRALERVVRRVDDYATRCQDAVAAVDPSFRGGRADL